MKRLTVIIDQMPGITGHPRSKPYATFEPDEFPSPPVELRVKGGSYPAKDGAVRGLPHIDGTTKATLALADGTSLDVELEPMGVQ